ncbi:Putative uncharacterized protein FLJ37770 [Araneus ventricosus]|uniref:Mos1 transposase HTH domain-containing protein n=1 Tax=Araneus ventricosus TaxID=182803 RepID=A0A4Y2GWH5_ARAVE|nr:Putative uncharacterized protein FLJ37770 [Araneus ventricosus]
MEQRVNIKFCFKLGKTATETHELLVKVYGVEAVRKKCVFEWFKLFRDGKEYVEDEPRSDQPPTSTTPDNIERVRRMLANDRRLSLRMIGEELKISLDSARPAYEGVLKRLLQRIRQVRPQLYQSGQWKLLHDNARPHTAIRVRQFLATRKVTVLEHPPYSPDLASADFLFPRLKGVLKGLRFSDIAQIQQRVTTVLRAIPKEAFADSFQQLYNRCQKCIVANGDYFECQ